jgi:hypothetical protein
MLLTVCGVPIPAKPVLDRFRIADPGQNDLQGC